MKKFNVIFLGEPGPDHIQSLHNIPKEYENYFCGWSYIYDSDPEKMLDKVTKHLDLLYEDNIEPIIMKGGNIHTEDYIRPIIKYYKAKHPDEKFFLSHCACFDDFILTDAALLTKYTEENIQSVLDNVVNLREILWANSLLRHGNGLASMLNAGGDTNLNTAPDYWVEIYNNLKKKNSQKQTHSFDIEMVQFDVAINRRIRQQKIKIDYIADEALPSVIIPSSINEGNSIWKAMTVIGGQSLAGIVVGLPMYIGLTSRTDTEESITKTLKYLLLILNVKDQ